MAQTIKIGVLNDMGDSPGTPGDVTDWLRREVAAVQSAGRLNANVEFVQAWGLGLPSGTGDAVERAFMDLVRQDVALITGPAIGDNALLATHWVEREQVPTINWAGAECARGEWMFHLQVGSHEDESLLIARHMLALGAKQVAVVYDQSPIGTRHLKYLEDEARIIGVEIIHSVSISPLAEEAHSQVASALADRPQGFIYLGLGLSAPAVAQALTATSWEGPRMMNTAGLRGYQNAFAAACNGWIYIDMYSDGNSTLNTLLATAPDNAPPAVWTAKGHDLGRLVAEGLARAENFTRAGVKTGLEQIKWLSAAEGKEGTQLGFGIYDRGALHGQYLVLRQWVDGKTIEV